MENIQRTSALQYIFSILFKTFDSCVHVTEVSFHWFLNYGHSRVARPRERGENALSAKWFTIPEEKELTKTHASNCEDRFCKSQHPQRYKLSDSTSDRLTSASVHLLEEINNCREL